MVCSSCQLSGWQPGQLTLGYTCIPCCIWTPGAWEQCQFPSILSPSLLLQKPGARLSSGAGQEAALGAGRHQGIASPPSASRAIPACSALDYQVPAKAPKASSVPFFSTRWWQAARHRQLRSLKTLLLKVEKARKSWSIPPCHTVVVQNSLHFYVGKHLSTMVTIQLIIWSDMT